MVSSFSCLELCQFVLQFVVALSWARAVRWTCRYSNAEFWWATGAAARHWNWPAEAVCLAKARFEVNQNHQIIITHFYVIFTLLLPLLVHMITSLLPHYYILIHLL